MSEDRDRLLKIMSSLEADYRSGKISADKYSYFRSKYEDKLNTIDAEAATMKIRSMQGKPSNTKKRKRSKKPTNKKKQEEQDLVQKYIINPKKGDARYNKTKKSSMDGGTFKLLLLLVLVIGFTAGVAYGVFNFDFDTVSQTEAVATVQDTAFPDFNEVINITNTTNLTTTTKNTTAVANSSSSTTVETTTDSSTSSQSSTQSSNTHTTSDTSSQSDSSSSSSQQSNSRSDSGSSSSQQSDSKPNQGSTTDRGNDGGNDGGT